MGPRVLTAGPRARLTWNRNDRAVRTSWLSDLRQRGVAGPVPSTVRGGRTNDLASAATTVVVCGRVAVFGYDDGIPTQEVFDRYYRGFEVRVSPAAGPSPEYDQRRLALICRPRRTPVACLPR